MTTIREGELEFDFASAKAERLDRTGVPQPEGMRLVDLLVEENSRLLLIEIKDPGQTRVPPDELRKFLAKLRTDELIHKELVPKARDSYTYLHLMKRDDRAFILVVVLGIEHTSPDPALLLAFTDRLRQRLRQETDTPWKRQYIQDSVVVTPQTWSGPFAAYPLKRIP